MRNIITFYTLHLAAAFFTCQGMHAQQEKNCTTENNCSVKKAEYPKNLQTMVKAESAKLVKAQKPVACKLTTPELQKRKQEVLVSLKKKVKEKTELPNGFMFRFEGSDAVLLELMEFIRTERACCNFFRFELVVQDDESPLFLSISGPDGAKEFIETEIGL